MLKIGILGASGFIGNRTVEMLCLEDNIEVRPIVRSSASLARLARFDLNCHIANALDRSALRAAFTGCDVVIHSVVGYPNFIRKTVTPTYQAAQEAGVRRLVYLSTASVHGQAPSPGTDERSPLSDRQPLAYNNAKVQAERKLLQLRAKGSVELVMLRPSIVFGPQSRWIAGLADDLLRGTAYLVNEGKGICNSIYVDNLVHAIRLAMTAEKDADGQAFLVGDREQVTWSNFYRPIAQSLGIDLAQVPHIACPKFTSSWQERFLEPVSALEPVQAVLSFSGKLKRVLKKVIPASNQSPPASPWITPAQRQPIVTQEIALLHQCQYKLPFEKAENILGYEPIVSFPEGCRRSIDWLASVGYPVLPDTQLKN